MLKRLYQKFYPAFCGLKDLIVTEGSVRLQIYITICALLGGYFIGFSDIELLIVAVLCTIVLCTECCNTLFEWLMNTCYPEYHETAKRMKDGAAAMVLVASIMSFIIGMIMVFRHLR